MCDIDLSRQSKLGVVKDALEALLLQWKSPQFFLEWNAVDDRKAALCLSVTAILLEHVDVSVILATSKQYLAAMVVTDAKFE